MCSPLESWFSAATFDDDRFITQNLEVLAGATNGMGETALMLAAYNDSINVVSRLVGCEAGRRDYSGKAAIHVAVERDSIVLCRILAPFESGLLVENGMNPFHLAARLAKPNALYALMPFYRLERDYDGNSALEHALLGDAPECLAVVLTGNHVGISEIDIAIAFADRLGLAEDLVDILLDAKNRLLSNRITQTYNCPTVRFPQMEGSLYASGVGAGTMGAKGSIPVHTNPVHQVPTQHIPPRPRPIPESRSTEVPSMMQSLHGQAVQRMQDKYQEDVARIRELLARKDMVMEEVAQARDFIVPFSNSNSVTASLNESVSPRNGPSACIEAQPADMPSAYDLPSIDEDRSPPGTDAPVVTMSRLSAPACDDSDMLSTATTTTSTTNTTKEAGNDHESRFSQSPALIKAREVLTRETTAPPVTREPPQRSQSLTHASNTTYDTSMSTVSKESVASSDALSVTNLATVPPQAAISVGQPGFTRLMQAASTGDLKTVRLLALTLAKHRDVTGKTALMYAAERGHCDIIRILAPLEAGMTLPNGGTALMHAVGNSYPDAAAILMVTEAGMQMEDGWTALMSAAALNDEDIVALLLDKEAGLTCNARSPYGDGFCAARIAAQNNFVGCLRILAPREATLVTQHKEEIPRYASSEEAQAVLALYI
ncbi:Ankyrin repeat protein 1 [Giardia muris]|uniref:Ankyrin repeat protein 1 n=1 Tax=Giardia muris TaxID=5742 RepID=A0A4Z1SY13_GIAMU|nr:Ankyrin repeat protein 1 [Giardia muris]|eukprot:TNJ30594.1 Ankyrin repeat protein 1 [Giardia muris]